MIVMHLSSEYPPTQVFGLGRAVCDLAVAQAKLGHEVHVVTNSLGGREAEAMVDGVRVHRIHFPPPPKPPDETSAVVQFNVLLVQKVVELLAIGLAPEVIHVHDWLTALAGRAAKHLAPAALLSVTIHDTVHGKHFGQLTPPNQYVSFLERFVGTEADLTICCSEHVRGELVQEYQVPPQKIAIIPCGVDASRFHIDADLTAFRQLLGEPSDRIVLYVGRLDREKGVSHLLEAMARVLLAVPQGRLVIAGKGVLEGNLVEMARSLHIDDRVTFMGYVQDEPLAALYRSADVLAVPSLYEPFGIVALEGMVCGRPVVASDVGGLTEIIVEDQTGLRVPPGDSSALARAIAHLLTDEQAAARMGAAARQRAEHEYNWARVAAQTAAAYTSTLSSPAGAQEVASRVECP